MRLLVAGVAGALIGVERELHDKPAGLRTNVMICLGAALFTVISIRVSEGAKIGDPARIAAQIVTGVGFLGAGAIIQTRGHVIGLTTAATIWIVASVGMALGAGEYLLGSIATVMTVGVLFGLSFVEEAIANWRTTAKFQIVMEPSPELNSAIKQHVRKMGLYRKAWRISKAPEGFVGFLKVIGPEQKLLELQKQLILEEGVKSLQRL
ncbi:MAG: MgtC/SapB family protein [Planctomycetota bacterium]